MSIFRLALGCVGSLALLCASALARAETLVLLTENLVPFNMAVNGGNYAKDDGISGISTDTVRAACERAQIECQLILRFPWDRVYQQALSEPGYGVFSTARTPEREDKFKWVGPLAVNDWVLMARGDSSIHLNSLEDAARYRIGGYKNDAISQHLVDRGLQVQLALRDNENVDKLASGQDRSLGHRRSERALRRPARGPQGGEGGPAFPYRRAVPGAEQGHPGRAGAEVANGGRRAAQRRLVEADPRALLTPRRRCWQKAGLAARRWLFCLAPGP